MKGTIIGLDQGAYLVSGDDGKRYQFLREDWLEKKAPNVGDTVDFVCEGDCIKSVLPLVSRKKSEPTRFALAVLCLFFGAFGTHRFMAHKLGTGLTMFLITLLTFGVGSLITIPWALIDFVIILCGYFRDSDGNKITKW